MQGLELMLPALNQHAASRDVLGVVLLLGKLVLEVGHLRRGRSNNARSALDPVSDSPAQLGEALPGLDPRHA